MAEEVKKGTEEKRTETNAGGNGHASDGRHAQTQNANQQGAPPDANGNAAADENARQQSAANDDDAQEQSAPPKKPVYKRPVFLAVASIALIVALVFGGRYYVHARTYQSTDDAFVDGNIVQISPKVSANVVKVYVNDNQYVKKNDLLVELDKKDFQARLDQARAQLAAAEAQQRQARAGENLTRVSTSAAVTQARSGVQGARSQVTAAQASAAARRSAYNQASAGVNTAQANLAQAQAQVRAAEAEATRAANDVQRYQELFNKDEVSRQRLDQAIAAAQTAQAQLEAARRRVSAAESQVNEARSAAATAADTYKQAVAQIGAAQAQVGEAQGRLADAAAAPQRIAVNQTQVQAAGATIEQARAAVAQAELELSYTEIRAPEDGRVTRKNVDIGQLVQPGQALMALVFGDVWVTANFKETQLDKIRVGQPVEIKVDAYPDVRFTGKVDSIQSGTGARFSVLPPENATGNYVKVVQRVPVKITFDNQPDDQYLVAPGMSVEPEVKVR